MSSKSLCLLIIDAQNDFQEGGSLGVPGAKGDTLRIIEFINSAPDRLAAIYLSRDSHNRTHISNASNWIDADGVPCNPFTTVTAQQVRDGVYYNIHYGPNEKHKLVQYCEALEGGGRFVLTLWPDHCIQETQGREIVSELWDAVQTWQKKTGGIVKVIDKGTCDHVEMYSVFKAEVICQECTAATEFNEDLKRELDQFDQVAICGEAKSHCVRYSAEDLLSLGEKLVFLEDCSSPVPGFEASCTEFKDLTKEIIVFQEIKDL